MSRSIAAVLGLGGMLVAAGCAANPAGTAMGPAGSWAAWVTSESADEVARVEYSAAGTEVTVTQPVGSMPVEIDGPHGVAASPDGKLIYVSIGHGLPYGSLWKIDVETRQVLARTELGLFPATVSVTPDGQYAFVSNFNLHGDPVPSSISKVHLPSMAEVSRIETCVRPHGSRINPQGTRHYSVCVTDQLLVEIDVASGEVSRFFSMDPAVMAGVARRDERPASGQTCSPTWAEPSADGSTVFVTCNAAGYVVEIDVDGWEEVRRFPTSQAPYNLGTTPDGRYLLVSLRNRDNAGVEVFDLGSGQRVAHMPTTTNLVHGIAITPDSRYAFVSVEGVGSEAGKVDVFDLSTLQRVGSAEVGPQATGIAYAP